MDFMQKLIIFLYIGIFSISNAMADSQYEVGKSAIESMTGCFLVDYSYSEIESLQEGYSVDPRVYDVNRNKSVKEWIYTTQMSPKRIILQHILFATDLEGNFMEYSMLKHHAEDWEYQADYLYDFERPLYWNIKPISGDQWTRRITNLDGGLRHQCAGQWNISTKYPEWSCGSFAPIPGRETRDMSRTDYNTMWRDTKVVIYGNTWLERQDNIKTIYENGERSPLAKELGKNWYVRLPDEECMPAMQFVKERKVFWNLVQQAWDLVLQGTHPFHERKISGMPRFVRMYELEEKYIALNLADPAVAQRAVNEIVALIGEYSAH